jgi:hypothetical protein
MSLNTKNFHSVKRQNQSLSFENKKLITLTWENVNVFTFDPNNQLFQKLKYCLKKKDDDLQSISLNKPKHIIKDGFSILFFTLVVLLSYRFYSNHYLIYLI